MKNEEEKRRSTNFVQRFAVRADHFVFGFLVEQLIALLVRREDQQRLIDVDLVGETLFQIQFFVLPIGQRVEKICHHRG